MSAGCRTRRPRVLRPPLDQRLDAAQAGRVGDQPQRAGHPVRVARRVAGDLEADHRAEARRSRAAAISWPGSPAARGSAPGSPGGAPASRRASSCGVGLGPLQAQRQRAHPAQREVALQRPGNRAAQRAPARAALGELGATASPARPSARRSARPGTSSTECMTMSAPRSSGRTTSGVENVASTPTQRARWRGRPATSAGRSGTVEQRVGDRLQPEQVARRPAAATTAAVSAMSTGRTVIRPSALLVEDRHRARVGGVGHHRHGAGRPRVDERRQRGHAAGEGERGPAPLQRRERRFQIAHRLAGLAAGVPVLGPGATERGRQHHRCRERRSGFGRPARGDDQRLRPHAPPRKDGRLTTIASCVLRAMTTTASVSGSLFSSRCGVNGGTKT